MISEIITIVVLLVGLYKLDEINRAVGHIQASIEYMKPDIESVKTSLAKKEQDINDIKTTLRLRPIAEGHS